VAGEHNPPAALALLARLRAASSAAHL